MIRNAIKRFSLLLIVFIATPALAQDITSVRDINAIPESQLMTLQAGGENLSSGDIEDNIFNELNGTTVTIEVVLMSDPRNSGLANVTDGRPSRVHVYARDIQAATEGNEGMGIQIVDGAFDTNNLLSFGIGEVLRITGDISPFGTTMQVSPSSIEFLGTLADLSLPETLLDPVVVTTDQINAAVGSDDGVQANFANLADLRGQFVRIEGATLQARSLTNPDRPDFYVSSDGGTTIANFYDTGLQFRNDRGDYPETFNNEDVTMLDDFVPPPPGSVLNLQGFLVFQGFADQIGRSVPDHGILSIVPFERRGCDGTEGFRCDIEVTETPPIISDLMGPAGIPTGDNDVTISFVTTADPSRTIDSNACIYFTSEDATEVSVDGTATGDMVECTIPAQADGVFTTYWATSTDNTGATSTSDPAFYRTLADGIDSIEDIQLTIDEGPGDSPFTGLTTTMDITATVQSDPSVSGLIVLQDDSELAGWTGIFLSESGTALQQGDLINITQADIFESFGVTTLGSATYDVMSSGNPTLDRKVVPTTVLLDESIAEAHEGMMLRFEEVVSGPERSFGEWSFATAGTEDFIFGDDASQSIANDFNTSIPEGTELAFIQGVWWFSFGDYKLVPESIMDVGIGGVNTEDGEQPFSFSLEQNFPNPFNPTTSISYAVPVAGQVTLEVFDLLGRSVSVLVDGVVSAGEHTYQFDAADLPSGMYLYRLTAGEQTTTRKMLLLK